MGDLRTIDLKIKGNLNELVSEVNKYINIPLNVQNIGVKSLSNLEVSISCSNDIEVETKIKKINNLPAHKSKRILFFIKPTKTGKFKVEIIARSMKKRKGEYPTKNLILPLNVLEKTINNKEKDEKKKIITTNEYILCLTCGSLNSKTSNMCKDCRSELRTQTVQSQDGARFCILCGEVLENYLKYCNKCGGKQ